jgi:DNA-binding NarL/FixJ family response regulator
MSTYLTEKELVDRYKFYLIELELLFEKGEDIFHLGENLPLGIHYNDSQTLHILDCNRYSLEYTGYSKEELYKMGEAYFEKHMHPYFRDVVAKQILAYVRSHPNEIVGFIQHLHLYGDESEFKPLMTFTKLSNEDSSTVFCIDVLPSAYKNLPQTIQQVIEMDAFKLKHIIQFQQLTQREKEILTLLAEGYNNPQIATQLFISRRTVETHRKHINRKLEIKHFRDLMKFALAFDLVTI